MEEKRDKPKKPKKELSIRESGQFQLPCLLSLDHPRLYIYPAASGPRLISTTNPVGVGRLEVREKDTGKVLKVLQRWGKPFRCALPLGEGKLATGQWGSPFVKVWDVESGLCLEEWDTLQGLEKNSWAAVCVHGLSHFSSSAPSTLITSTLIESLVIAKDIRTNPQTPPPPVWNSFVSCWDMREKTKTRSKSFKPFLTRDFIYQIEPVRKGLDEVVLVTSYSDASGKYSALQRYHPQTGDRKKLKKPQIKQQHKHQPLPQQPKSFDSQINCVGICSTRDNGYTLACGSSDGYLSKWQFVKGDSRPKIRLVSGQSPSGIQDLTMLNKHTVVSISKRGEINFWDMDNDACLPPSVSHRPLSATGDRGKNPAGFHSILRSDKREFLSYDHYGLVKLWEFSQ